ncbi:MAG TPA: response regulator [Micavibrio sp.]|jgi:CheY-like chemotaxis protein
MEHESLSGLRVLVVEDEPMLAFVFKTMLEDAGGEVVGPANRIQSALDLIHNNGFDCAIMDVRLDGQTAYPLAKELTQRRIPFVFITGNSADTLPSEYQHKPMLLKPVGCRELISVINVMTAAA